MRKIRSYKPRIDTANKDGFTKVHDWLSVECFPSTTPVNPHSVLHFLHDAVGRANRNMSRKVSHCVAPSLSHTVHNSLDSRVFGSDEMSRPSHTQNWP
jgi:hypothetical protein